MKKRNFLFWFGGRIGGSSSFSLSKPGSLNIHPDACHRSRKMIGFKVRISLIYYSFWSRRWNSFMQLQIRKLRHSLKRTLSNQMQLFLHPDRCSPMLDLMEERQEEEQGKTWNEACTHLPSRISSEGKRLAGSGEKGGQGGSSSGGQQAGKEIHTHRGPPWCPALHWNHPIESLQRPFKQELCSKRLSGSPGVTQLAGTWSQLVWPLSLEPGAAVS